MQWGSIINISSLSSFGPVPTRRHDAACSAAVNSFSQTTAHELAPGLGIGHPRDVGDAVVDLASDAARWVTGQTQVISRGMSVF
jgi:NAD(P)-dependent dehydrogenase (short-subunit alcohol dehydrogenase family)